MLSVSSYAKTYIDGFRAKIDVLISAYEDLVSVARGLIGTSETRLEAALDTFEPLYCNNMVMVLDDYFLHRSRDMELKDGNPLNEVRVLCNSMRDNDGIMAADKTIKLDPATSLLKYQVGDEIKLCVGDFQRVSDAFFAEIERKYP